jgi:tetratricopeptide (TPR) repeat protein
VDAALPHADDKAVMLAGTFLLCRLHLETVDTVRNFLPRLQALEAATGLSIIPAGLIEYGQPEAAAQHLQEALHQAERAPANGPDYLTETAKAHLLAAGIAYRAGRPEEGKAAVDRALVRTDRLDGRWLTQAHLLHRAARLLFEYDHPAAAGP